MIYQLHLSSILNQDIYSEDNNIFLVYGSNKHLIGTLKSPIPELRSNIESFISTT